MDNADASRVAPRASTDRGDWYRKEIDVKRRRIFGFVPTGVNRQAPRKEKNPQIRRHQARPGVECLEGRELLSGNTLIVNQTGDGNAVGTLRWAVQVADTNTSPVPDTIEVNEPWIFLDAANGPLTVTEPVVVDDNDAEIFDSSPAIEINTGPVFEPVVLDDLAVNFNALSTAITIDTGSIVNMVNANLQGHGHGAGSTGDGTAITNSGSLSFQGTVADFDYGIQNIGGAAYISASNFSYMNKSAVDNISGEVDDTGSYYWANGSNQAAAIVNYAQMWLSDDEILGSDGPYTLGAGVVSIGGNTNLDGVTLSSTVGSWAVYAQGGYLTESGCLVLGNSNGALFLMDVTGNLNNTTIGANALFGPDNVVFFNSTVSIGDTTIAGNLQNDTAAYAEANSSVTLTGGNRFGNNGPIPILPPLTGVSVPASQPAPISTSALGTVTLTQSSPSTAAGTTTNSTSTSTAASLVVPTTVNLIDLALETVSLRRGSFDGLEGDIVTIHAKRAPHQKHPKVVVLNFTTRVSLDAEVKVGKKTIIKDVIPADTNVQLSVLEASLNRLAPEILGLAGVHV